MTGPRIALTVSDWATGLAEGQERERRARVWGSRDYNIGYRSASDSEWGHVLSCLGERAFGKLTGLPLPSRIDYDGNPFDFCGPSGVLVNVKASDRLDRGLSCTPERLNQRWHPSVEIAVKVCVVPKIATIVGWLDRATFIAKHRVWQGPDYSLWIVDAYDLFPFPALIDRLGLPFKLQ